MKPAGIFERIGHTALLLLFCALFFNSQPKSTDEHHKKTGKGYFISASKHFTGILSGDDYSNPADNEEDEDDDEDDDEDRAESLDSKYCHEFIVSLSHGVRQDRLFCDPLDELISPPPKF